MTGIEFLQPDIAQIRHQIKGIIESYSHEWDLIGELAQNAVDAIRSSDRAKGHIEIEIDAPSRSIVFSDNGSGIDPSRIAELMRPFGTNKSGNAKLIGEKGVGLSFIIFSSFEFSIASSHSNGKLTKSISGASHWLDSTTLEPLLMKDGDLSPSEFGTKITLKIEEDHPIFDVTIDQLIYVLRTKTALGDCGYIWDDVFNCDCLVAIVDKAGNRQEKSFECAYLRPIDVLKSGDFIDILDFKDWLKEQDRSDIEKRKKLINKVVTSVGKTFQSGREIRFWSCFVPRRNVWDQLSRNARIMVSNEVDEEVDFENSWIGGFAGGLWTSTKGMPTGISIDLRPKGSAGYVPNFFMIIDDPSLSFDIGRKSVQGRQQSMLRELAYDTFREYINSVRKYMGGALEEDPTVWERDEIFNSINELPNLGSEKTSFIKRPNAQEATVVAIFFEMLGSGHFSQVKPLVSGYKGRYDLYARWEKKNVVIEFKYDLLGLFKDFTDERKMFDEVDVLVVWEVTEKDYALAKRRGIEIFDITSTSLDASKRFPGATKTMSIPAVKPLFVVEIRKLT